MDRTDGASPELAQHDEAERLKADIERTRRQLAETAEQLAAKTGITRLVASPRARTAAHARPRPQLPAVTAAAAAVAAAATAALVAVRRWRKR